VPVKLKQIDAALDEIVVSALGQRRRHNHLLRIG
jgi:hypothetical protein